MDPLRVRIEASRQGAVPEGLRGSALVEVLHAVAEVELQGPQRDAEDGVTGGRPCTRVLLRCARSHKAPAMPPGWRPQDPALTQRCPLRGHVTLTLVLEGVELNYS